VFKSAADDYHSSGALARNRRCHIFKSPIVTTRVDLMAAQPMKGHAPAAPSVSLAACIAPRSRQKLRRFKRIHRGKSR
jgi:hypothetical protein